MVHQDVSAAHPGHVDELRLRLDAGDRRRHGSARLDVAHRSAQVELAPAYYILLLGIVGLAIMWPMAETNGRALDA